MTDRLTPIQRSQNMARIRGRNTKPELAVRSALFKAGFRFRLHKKGLPGRPDLVLPKYRLAVFVHGCFWHGHSCRRGSLPASNVAFWTKKIRGNVERDQRNIAALRQTGWNVAVLWACKLEADTTKLIRKLRVLRQRTRAKARRN
ncbi:MAG: very short patch repair endonuclease [Pseudorhodoplanes sp.]|jgi:DNA mismatch endonuclease (patch repair protein)|nr:very short patch repair endonuclease [Pseudorhodoplanes sp.]